MTVHHISNVTDLSKSATDVNNISIKSMDRMIADAVSLDVEEVEIPKTPKTTFADAVHLFPLSIHKRGQLNITCNPDMDKIAAPSTPVLIQHESTSTSDNTTASQHHIASSDMDTQQPQPVL